MRRKDYGKETPGHTKNMSRDDGEQTENDDESEGATKQKQRTTPKNTPQKLHTSSLKPQLQSPKEEKKVQKTRKPQNTRKRYSPLSLPKKYAIKLCINPSCCAIPL